MFVVAHRGYSAAYPENTALGFERAIEAGAEYVETDVRFTRDGALVCSHDPDLRRITGDARPVASLTLEDIRAVKLAHGQHVLALEEVLVLVRGRARLMLDVKVTTLDMVEAIALALERTQMSGDVIYGARTVEHLIDFAARCPEVAILGMPKTPALAAAFLAHTTKAIRYWEDEVTPERVSLAHRARRSVWVTAGLRARHEAPGYITAARAQALAQSGVDALLVNDPTQAPRR